MSKQKATNKTPKQVQKELNQKRIATLSKEISKTVEKIQKIV